MLKIEISDTDMQQLHYERFHQLHPRVMLKMEAVYLKGIGLKNDLISRITGVCGNTLRKYLKEYAEGGIEQLKSVKFYQPQSDLKEYSGTIEEYFLENPPRSIGEAAAKIRELTGIERKETQVYKGWFGASKSIDGGKKNEQREFLEESINPRLAEAKEGKRVVLFADAVHFVCGSFLGCLWCIARIFVPTMSGRQRYNVLGAIDAITHDLHTVCNNTYINALSVCELLDQISKTYAGKTVTIILDNAKYQKCALVAELAKNLNIDLLYLPSYSPNLNLIARLWKWTKKDCLNCKYYETFALFKEAIDKSLMKIKNHENKGDLDTLLTLNFQLYDNAIYKRA